jgi:PAS domain S-box-containing protein
MTHPTTDERFSYLFELIGDPVVEIELVDDTPVVRTVNPAFEEVFGYPAERIRGESLNELIVPDESADEAIRFDQRTADGKYNSGVVTRLTAGGPRDFLYRGVPYERDGAEFGFAIYTDITDRNRRKRELQRQNERLEEFTRILSHDLRNPLNVAKGKIGMIDHSQADTIERNLDRIEAIIDDVLRLAWGGKAIEETESVPLSLLCERSWEHVDTGGATLTVASDGQITADPSRLQQLLENLFRNSVEHGSTDNRPQAGDSVEHGGDDVTITVGVIDSPPGFYVEDDGVGISATDQEAVFKRGYSSTDGTGLGLPIVESISDAHGWEVTLTDSEDGGVRFEFTGC